MDHCIHSGCSIYYYYTKDLQCILLSTYRVLCAQILWLNLPTLYEYESVLYWGYTICCIVITVTLLSVLSAKKYCITLQFGNESAIIRCCINTGFIIPFSNSTVFLILQNLDACNPVLRAQARARLQIFEDDAWVKLLHTISIIKICPKLLSFVFAEPQLKC